MKSLMIGDKDKACCNGDYQFISVIGTDPFEIESHSNIYSILGPNRVRLWIISPTGRLTFTISPELFNSFTEYKETPNESHNTISFTINSDADILNAIETLLRMR